MFLLIQYTDVKEIYHSLTIIGGPHPPPDSDGPVVGLYGDFTGPLGQMF